MSSKYLKAAVRAARKAGRLIMDNLGKVREIDYKGEINLVTEVDKNSEMLIRDILKKDFPDFSFLGEEFGSDEEGAKSEFRWVVDPLDGTTNYTHGFPFFCVSIGLEKAGEVICGVIYEPVRDELFTAEKGKGAFLNGKRISSSKEEDLGKALLATGFAYNVRDTKRNNMDNFENFLMEARAVRRAGSACIDLAYVACGRFDGFWELNLFPWDVAAGSILVSEAGGKVTNFEETPFNLQMKEILASNGKIHSQMSRVLNKK